MKTKAKFLLCFAATCFAFVGAAQAQLMTYQTVQPIAPSGGYDGNVSSFNTGSRITQGEVFTNVLAIDSMTYNLFSTGSPVASQLSATFGQWDTTTNSFVGTTLDLGTINVPAIDGWSSVTIGTGPGATTLSTFNVALDITLHNGGNLYTTNANLSYAVMLTNLSGGNTNYGIGRTDGESDFAYGTGLFVSNTGVATAATDDYAFTQIVVAPYVAPTPEAGTVAAIVGAGLVAGLVGFRLRQRRQLVPVQACAA